LPSDLVAVVVAVCLVNVAAAVPVVRESPVRTLVGLAFLLFVPGYAVTAALFPEARSHSVSVTAGSGAEPDSQTAAGGSRVPGHAGSVAEGFVRPRGGIAPIERVTLSVGLSTAVLPIVGLGLNFTPWGIRLGPLLASVSAITVAAAGIAAWRRMALPPDNRFRVQFREGARGVRRQLVAPPTRLDLGLNVLVGLSVLVVLISVGYGVLAPHGGNSFSELYLLTESADGELVATDYPSEFTVGEGQDLVVAVKNGEGDRTNYTVVVQVQGVRRGNGTDPVVRSERLGTYEQSLPPGYTWYLRDTVVPPFEGTDLRVQYLLYRGEPPAEPRVGNAYRNTHLWINVTG